MIGIRMALGAGCKAVIVMVLREVPVMVLTAILFGVPAALAGGRLISGMLLSLAPSDPGPWLPQVQDQDHSEWLSAPAFIPVRQGSRIQPIEALRTE